MTGCGLLLMMMALAAAMLSITCVSEPLFRSPQANGTRWELLEAAANQIHIDKDIMITVEESYRYDLWNRYTSSSRSQRLEIVNEISESLKEVAFRDNRYDMVGLILFGPEMGRLLLRVANDKLPDPVDVLDFLHCSMTINDFFEKHCGPTPFKGLRHTHSTSNLCYLATMEAIEEAVLLSCGMNSIDPVPQQQLLFMAPSASKWIPFEIFLSYVGSPCAMVAVASCLALRYVIGPIIASILSKKREFPWKKLKDSCGLKISFRMIAALMWTSCLLLMATSAMVTATSLSPHAELLEVFAESRLDETENRARWDALRAISVPIKERDVYLSHMWEQYKSPSTSKRPTTAKEILDAVTKIAYLDSRIDMIAFLLFGPTKGWSVLRAVRDKYPDDSPGLKSMLKLFEKHCGVITEHGMKQSLANIHRYAVEKEAIHEAIILACGMHKTETHGIDVTNPKVDITPAPIHGTFQYCGRVSVNGVPRTKSHVKTYQVKVVPSEWIHLTWHRMIHICFHRNDSLELCQCEKDDWRSIQKGSWSSVMPSYEQRFVDVKFVAGISNFVTVTLDEVSPAQGSHPAQGWHYGFLAGAIGLLFMAVSKARISFQKKLSTRTSQQPTGSEEFPKERTCKGAGDREFRKNQNLSGSGSEVDS